MSAERRITAVVVTHDSAAVIESCLSKLAAAAPTRGLDVRVVDNASRDDSAAVAERLLGAGAVIRLRENRGFAAGVNAVLSGFSGEWLAVLNPDLDVPPGALDRLADALERWPRAGLAGPRVRRPDGGVERTAGYLPTLARERAHALFLDRLLGREGRVAHLPPRDGPVEWLSGCAWLLRGTAVRAVGPLDEAYFMYFEDVDYCRRLLDAGWQVLAVPEVEVVHAFGRGSTGSDALPADGGGALLRYFRKWEADVPEDAIRRELQRGWRLRRAWHLARWALGSRRSRVVAKRYARALEVTVGAPPD